MKKIIKTTRFNKDYSRIIKRGQNKEKLTKIMTLLMLEEPLPERCRLHKLSGSYAGYWECHITPDWLLIYFEEDENTIRLQRTGSHSDLF